MSTESIVVGLLQWQVRRLRSAERVRRRRHRWTLHLFLRVVMRAWHIRHIAYLTATARCVMRAYRMRLAKRRGRRMRQQARWMARRLQAMWRGRAVRRRLDEVMQQRRRASEHRAFALQSLADLSLMHAHVMLLACCGRHVSRMDVRSWGCNKRQSIGSVVRSVSGAARRIKDANYGFVKLGEAMVGNPVVAAFHAVCKLSSSRKEMSATKFLSLLRSAGGIVVEAAVASGGGAGESGSGPGRGHGHRDGRERERRTSNNGGDASRSRGDGDDDSSHPPTVTTAAPRSPRCKREDLDILVLKAKANLLARGSGAGGRVSRSAVLSTHSHAPSQSLRRM